MEIKATVQGGMIYAIMCVFLMALLLNLLKRKNAGRLFYLWGFILALIAYVYRWLHVGHVPMQNLFEVFLLMGVLIWPMSFFCRRKLDIGGETADIVLGLIVLFPAGFIFHERPGMLPPALQCWLFAPHVLVYMLSYILMAKGAVQALAALNPNLKLANQGTLDHEEAAYRMTLLGFPLLTAGLLLGSFWAKLAWSDYWGWDPKEMWSLASWLIYLGYFHFRAIYGQRFKKTICLWNLAGIVVIIITLLWVNLSKVFSGLHSYAT